MAGISFENRDGVSRQIYARLVKRGQALHLRREPENPFDAYAIAVDWPDGSGTAYQLGYVPRALSTVLAPLLDQGATPRARVLTVGSGGPRLARGRLQPGARQIDGRPPIGVRMRIDLDLGTLPEAQRTGLEPVIAAALAQDAEAPDLAPSLGSPTPRDREAPHL